MAFKFTCPHCNAALNVTDPAFGKTIPCPGCNQPINVPQPPPSRQPSYVPALRRRLARRLTIVGSRSRLPSTLSCRRRCSEQFKTATRCRK